MRRGRLTRAARILSEQRSPARFVLSRLLMRSGLSTRFVIDRGDHRLRFHPTALSATLWIDPSARARMEAFLRRYLRPGDTVIDVGANIGSLTLTAAAAVGPTGRVFAFEPDPASFRALQDNIALNQATQVTAEAIALGETNAEIGLTQSEADDQHRIALDSETGAAVPQRRLDSLNITGHVALLKIDVEGYELPVLRGVQGLLADIDCIVFEYAPEHFRRYGYSPEDPLVFLRRNGFAIYRQVEASLEPIPSGAGSSRDDLLAIRDLGEFRERMELRTGL